MINAIKRYDALISLAENNIELETKALSILLCFMSICVLSGCGDNSDSDYDNTESTYDSDYDSSYDDWDTDNNGEADWQDVDTDNDGNVSQDEMQDYVEDWEAC